MEKAIKFAVSDIKKIENSDYNSDEFAIAHMGFLSTRPNSHELKISEEVLRKSAPSVLGKWLVADMSSVVDAGTHTEKEHIVGQIPANQEVEFVEDEDGYTRAYADVVVSKIYAKDFCNIFENDNNRAVSVEMTCEMDEEDEDLVLSFNIVGVTALGKAIRPSCPQSDITFTRFSEDEANTFFNKVHHMSTLENFVQKRKQQMAETKKYKIDKSKESVSDKPWGEVDKSAMRDKIMEASNKDSLVRSVYALVEEGWQEAPSEHLKYPIMELKGDTFVYNKNGLGSALGYAKKENETAVVNKINKIYKNLGLEATDSGKEEDAKMAKEIEFAAVDIGDMWGKLYSAIRSHDGWRYGIEGIYEEDNKKFAVLRDEDGTLYRLDFSLTEEGMTVAEELIEVQKEFIETDKVVRFAEPENVEDYRKFAEDVDDDDNDKDDHDDHDDCDPEDKAEGDEDCDEGETKKMSADEMEAEMAKLKKDVEDRDNIIMGKDIELEQLRAFKKCVEDKEKAVTVEAVLEQVKGCLSAEQMKTFREEGIACEMSALDGWSNKVKAVSFEASVGKKNNKRNADDVWRFGAPANTPKAETVWDRIKNL